HLLAPLTLPRLFLDQHATPRDLHSFPTRRSSDLRRRRGRGGRGVSLSAPHPGLRLLDRDPGRGARRQVPLGARRGTHSTALELRSEEHTSELQSLRHLVCRLLLEKKKKECSTLCT